MVQVQTRVTGLAETEKRLRAIEVAAGGIGQVRIFVGADDPRARWFEVGFRPRGGSTTVPGRRMLERAAQAHLGGLGEAVAAALESEVRPGHAAVEVMIARARQIAAAAAAQAPVGDRPTRLRGHGRLRDEYLVRIARSRR